MIVTLAAWLYIVQALLGLGSLFMGPFGLGGGASNFAALLVSAVYGAMGYALLKREAWGRWLALGISLMSWTLGSLILVGLLILAVSSGGTGKFFAMMFSNGALAFVAVILVISVLVMIVSVVISFKLFFHLCSEEGCEEFDVPHGSASTVVASVGAWIAIFVGQMFMSSGGSAALGLLLAQQAMARNQHDAPEVDRARDRMEAERREYMRQREEQQRRAAQEARLRAIRDEPEQQAVAVTAADDSPPPPPPPPVESQPVAMDAGVEDEKPDAMRILKCRDPAGAVTFTQGYCPAGTKRVDMTRSE